MPYFAIFTTLGLQRLAEAQASGVPLVFATVRVGDGNGSEITPLASMTALVNEVASVDVNLVEIHPDAPSTVRVEGLIPAATGGFTIREAGLFNGDDEMIAIASYPPTYKPNLADGVSVDEYIRILLVYENLEEAIELTADLSVVTATRPYVDARVDELTARIAVQEARTAGQFGDGSDGDVELDGTNTYASFSSKVGNTYSLTRDLFAENLTITDSSTLETHGFRVYVRTVCEVVSGVIRAQGGLSTGSTGGGAVGSDGTIVVGGAGGNGGGAGAGSNGSAGGGVGYSGSGAAGGSGTAGAGGSGGSSLPSAPQYGSPHAYAAPWLGFQCGGGSDPLTDGVGVAYCLQGGTGGGGGGGNGAGNTGGGGGGGAGVVAMAAREIILSGALAITAIGGNGAAGQASNGGGGGGGGGGTILLVYERLTIDGGGILEGAVNCAGGSGGASGGGSGNAGGDGSDGTVFEICIVADESPETSAGHIEDGYITVAAPGAGTSYAVTFDTLFAAATGDNGYDFDVQISFDDDPYDAVPQWWVTAKTTAGFTINLTDDNFTGEIRWWARSRSTTP